MRLHRTLLVTALLLSAPLPAQRQPAAHPGVEAFNRAFAQATHEMSNAGILALWDENGVSLLPSNKPIIGKAAITTFLTNVMQSLAGAHMTKFQSECHDIQEAGDWASEWCTEHQIVDLGAGKEPFDGYGKMLLVLHRGPDGAWRIREEMWNQGLPADSPP